MIVRVAPDAIAEEADGLFGRRRLPRGSGRAAAAGREGAAGRAAPDSRPSLLSLADKTAAPITTIRVNLTFVFIARGISFSPARLPTS
jgi:hypothetical protein